MCYTVEDEGFRVLRRIHFMPGSNVFHSVDRAGSQLDDPVVTIGNFDGVHVGHRAIFDRTCALAESANVDAVALTFSPHPVRFFRPDADEFRLTTDRQKFGLIQSCGIDAVVAVEFDERLANLSPAEFVSAIIDEGLGAHHVLVGANFAFGKDRAGSTDDLRRLAGERGIETAVMDEIRRAGETVSSTRIREMIQRGDVSDASQLLGRNHRLVGEVERGAERGRALGYPTANLAAENLIPANGIYATYLHLPDGRALPAATSIGVRPTFDEAKRTVEAYALDRTDLSLYGVSVELEFVEYLRPEEDFGSTEELVAQMERDVDRVRESLEGTSPAKLRDQYADSGT